MTGVCSLLSPGVYSIGLSHVGGLVCRGCTRDAREGGVSNTPYIVHEQYAVHACIIRSRYGLRDRAPAHSHRKRYRITIDHTWGTLRATPLSYTKRPTDGRAVTHSDYQEKD